MIIRRYDSIEINSNTENERMNLLNKIRSLAECLQDQDLQYNFTEKIIKEYSNRICIQIEDIKINYPKSINEDNYEKNCGLFTIILIEVEKLFKLSQEKIHNIFQTCRRDFARKIYTEIIEEPLEKLVDLLNEILKKIQKPNVKKIDFYLCVDAVNIFHEKLKFSFDNLIHDYDDDLSESLLSTINKIEQECFNFIENEVNKISQENSKTVNESISDLTNKSIRFLNKICIFDSFFKRMINLMDSSKKINPDDIINILIERLEKNSTQLEKKYFPLKYLFLLNNLSYVQIKAQAIPLNNFITKPLIEKLNEKSKEYFNSYLFHTWNKVEEITFNQNDLNNICNADGTLKSNGKDLIKKKFTVFNEIMILNLKFQQNAQIVESYIEKEIIKSNIETIVKRYMNFYNKFANLNFTKVKDKVVIYNNESDVERDLKLYFSNPLGA